MTTPFFTKDLEGQEVFFVPTGNHVHRSGNRDPFSQVSKATIVKVARKFVTFKQEQFRSESKLRVNDHYKNWLHSDNEGYEVYLTLKEIEEQKLMLQVRSKLRNSLDDITREKAAAIAKIMGWEFE